MAAIVCIARGNSNKPTLAMRTRRPSPQRRIIQSSPSRLYAAAPQKHHQQRIKSFQCKAIIFMCSLAFAWSLGVLYFLRTFHSTPNSNSSVDTLAVSGNVVLSTKKYLQSNRLRKPVHSIDTPSKHFQLQQSSSWSWPLIHIVSTRFMQGQGRLLFLGRSRLKLLEVICLPSILKQSILEKEVLEEVYNHTKWSAVVSKLSERQLHNLDGIDPLFLWVIKVDPDLDPTLLQELNAVLEPVKKFTLVVGSNTNYGIGIKTGGWRDGQSGSDLLDAFANDRVYFPNDRQYAHDIITRAHEARLDRVVLETRLDADDAINIAYFSVLHYTALKDLVDYSDSGFISNDDEFEQNTDDTTIQQSLTQRETAKWIYWCPHRHIQWNPSTSFYNPNNDPGMLSVFESPNVCVTPGLTLGFAAGTDESDVPRYEHTHVYWEINHGNFKTSDDKQHDCGLLPNSRCAVFVENPFVSAFRSRAMTSAGMHMMEALGKPSMDTPDYYTEVSTKLWKKHIENYFGIIPEQAKDAADYLMDIYVDTVRDNLKGQCTKGHSCKISSLEKLQETIDILEEQVGGVDVGNGT